MFNLLSDISRHYASTIYIKYLAVWEECGAGIHMIPSSPLYRRIHSEIWSTSWYKHTFLNMLYRQPGDVFFWNIRKQPYSVPLKRLFSMQLHKKALVWKISVHRTAVQVERSDVHNSKCRWSSQTNYTPILKIYFLSQNINVAYG
jgi:hypothetical protein